MLNISATEKRNVFFSVLVYIHVTIDCGKGRGQKSCKVGSNASSTAAVIFFSEQFTFLHYI